MRRKTLLGLLAGAVAAAPLPALAVDQPKPSPNVDIGKPFPLLTVVARDGVEYDVPASDGRATMITLFASWCPPCRVEMPRIVGDAHRFRDKLFTIGFDVFEPDEKAATYMDAIKVGFPVATLATTDKDFFGQLGIPHTILIDKHGIVRDMWAGVDESDERDPLFGHLQRIGIS